MVVRAPGSGLREPVPVNIRHTPMPSPTSLLSTMMSSSLEEPFEMLAACHQRVLEMLDLLERLGAHLEQIGADGPARQAAKDLMRFFDLAAAHHHDDEELHLVPRLRRLDNDALAQRLLEEHRALVRQWSQIRVGLGRLSLHDDELSEGLTVRRAAWKRFADDYRAHIALEEREAFPAVRPSIDASAMTTMGDEISGRRVSRAGSEALRGSE
jgi:hemerythrin-like domain-containing protein